MSFIGFRFVSQQVNGDSLSLPFSTELESLKAEILREIRTEVQKAKQEILDGELKRGKWS